MNNVTQVSENKIKEMVKNSHRYGECLLSLLDRMKGRIGWEGASVKEMKKYGYVLDNDTQVKVSYCYMEEYNGLSVLFSEIFNATFTNDLHHATIKDFNKLVKMVSEMENDGYAY